jgi:transcription termination factor Rho
MTAEQQLERSVLERKEREELRAIAQAMSLDTNSRSKKADIIDQILRAAGVEVSAGSANGATDAPTRSRGAGRSAATNGDAGEIELDGGASNGSGPGRQSANGSSSSPSSASTSVSSSSAESHVDVESDSAESHSTDGLTDQSSGGQAATEHDGPGSSVDRSPSSARQAVVEESASFRAVARKRSTPAS